MGSIKKKEPQKSDLDQLCPEEWVRIPVTDHETLVESSHKGLTQVKQLPGNVMKEGEAKINHSLCCYSDISHS